MLCVFVVIIAIVIYFVFFNKDDESETDESEDEVADEVTVADEEVTPTPITTDSDTTTTNETNYAEVETVEDENEEEILQTRSDLQNVNDAINDAGAILTGGKTTTIKKMESNFNAQVERQEIQYHTDNCAVDISNVGTRGAMVHSITKCGTDNNTNTNTGQLNVNIQNFEF